MLVLLAAVLAGKDALPQRSVPAVRIERYDADVLIVRSIVPMEALRIRELAEKYDFYVEWSGDRRVAQILLYTGKPEFEIEIETKRVGLPARIEVFKEPNPKRKAVRF